MLTCQQTVTIFPQSGPGTAEWTEPSLLEEYEVAVLHRVVDLPVHW